MKRNFVVSLFGSLIGFGMVFILLSTAGIVGARGADVARSDVSRANEVSAAAPLTSTFTYQGQLKNSGSSISATCDFQFGLWDSASGSAQIGITQTVSSQVSNGLFTVGLNFGANGHVFDGNGRWLQIAVRCPPASSYTPLNPRQPLTAAPYAFALPGLYTQPNATSPNIIGGYSGNFISATVVGSVIGGGGDSGAPNRVQASYATIGGGIGNTASGYDATIGGGDNNKASDSYATVGGGYANIASNSNAIVGGGESNTASGYDAAIGGGESNTASGTYATIGGGLSNSADGGNGGYYATISGGYYNYASEENATVGGGEANWASGRNSTVGGGNGNSASANYATVGGGGTNTASFTGTTVSGGYLNTASANYATVSGGYSNTVSGYEAIVGGGYRNTASNFYATVGGGISNTASGAGAFVGGGGYDGSTSAGNHATGNASTIGGGFRNLASGGDATVSGGISNTASGPGASVSGGYNSASNWYATVAGGDSNNASGDHATIGGGGFNIASNNYATVAGGDHNNASGDRATIGGGISNLASGVYATVPGGVLNSATMSYTFAAGRQAKANHQGAFVWADSTGTDFASTGNNQFLIRASGGITLYTNSSATIGAAVAPGSGSWSVVSDRNLKENFTSVDGRDILARLASVPIQTWNYTAQDTSIRHIGPMAQDFASAFNLGENNTTISTVDAQGVALAAIQGLNQVMQDKDATIAAQQQQIADLQTRLSKIEQNTTASNPPSQAEPFNVATLSSVFALIAVGWLWLQQRRSKRGEL